MRMRVIFTGHVQGVGFRATTRSLAANWPISGFVRNEPDGSVYMEAQGSKEAILGLLQGLRKQFARAIVSEDCAEIPNRPDEHGFFIQR